MIDGVNNRVSEANATRIEGDCNNMWEESEVLLEKVEDSLRDVHPATSRTWVFENDLVEPNNMGYQPAYELLFNDGIKRMATKKSRIVKRAPFMDSNVIVTPYHDETQFDDQYLMGPFPCEKPFNDGIVIDDIKDQGIVDKDLVAWATIGFSHAPIVENFPVLLCEKLGFTLTPSQFFDQNPTMDVDTDTFISIV